MNGPTIPLEILRLAEAFVFASPEPVTWKTLRPLLPDPLDPTDVLEAPSTCWVLHAAISGATLGTRIVTQRRRRR